MQLQQIDLTPGESICVGHLIVTLLEVEGGEVALKIEDPGCLYGLSENDSATLCEPELLSV